MKALAKAGRIGGAHRSRRHPLRASVLAAAVAAALAACGGNDDGESSVSAPTTTSSTTAVPVTVIDGPLTGTVVCLDKNGNGICDSGEPTATTGAGGTATLTVANADVGLYPVVAMVASTTSIDADTGPVPVPYVLQAPADQTAVISPLTTLVKAQMESAGGSAAQAAAQIQSQTGLTISPLANYSLTRTTDAGALAAATLARLVVLTTQAQVTALTAAGASVVGQSDVSGGTVTATDVQIAAIKSLLASLPALATAATAAGVTASSTAAAADSALAAQSSALIASGQAGLDASTALAAVGVAKLPPDTSANSAQATANLRALRFTDVNNWFFRASEATVADNTVDANGKVHYYDNRTQDVAGVLTSWGFNNSPARQGDLHWNGSAWTGCPLGFRNTQTPRDANGRTSYSYCDNLELGSSQRSATDVSGKKLSDVVATIRALPGGDGGVAYANFGPTDLGLLGTATFPTGSLLYHVSAVFGNWAFAYDVQTSAIVNGYPAAIAAGGDASAAAGTAAAACGVVTTSNTSTYFTPVKTLEGLVALNPGAPCVYGPTTSGLAIANEWWSNSSASLGTIAGAATPPSSTVFTTTEALRVAFVPGGNVTRYLSCLVRADNGSSRSCTEIGRGTYAIQTLGDARVMTFANLPLEAVRLGYARVFVERGANVYFGYQSYGGTSSTVRLNLAAANALLGQLGMPTLNPQ